MPAALLLTGGASRRFGGPKADVRVGGERLADRSARVLTVVAAPVLEVGPGRSPLEAVLEDVPGSGPLAAVAAGAAALAVRGAGDQEVIVLAVDLPFVDEAWLRSLAALPVADAIVPRVDGRAQPLCARYSPAALGRAAQLVAEGARSMWALLEAIEVQWVDEPEWLGVTSLRCFVDVDTPDDARRFGLEPPG
jgi:molybdopterin-guanine dinucleotide biosynthesis protein A